MQLLLNVGGPDRVSRVQMAEGVAQIRGHDSSLIKPVSASSVSVPYYRLNDMEKKFLFLCSELGSKP